MKTAQYPVGTLILTLLACASLRAQAPATPPASSDNMAQQYPTAPQGPVPLSEEPHHRLLLQNDFARVYNVTVAGLDSTLLHNHDLPYLYVVLGPADIINAITGKPEAHQVLQDGETHFSPGHFAHIVRTDSGVPFRNVTIELVHPQGALKNLCKEVLPSGPQACPETAAQEKAEATAKPATAETKRAKGSKNAADKSKSSAPVEPGTPNNEVPYFETDEVRVDLRKVSSGSDYVDAAPKSDALLVALSDANLDANLAGEHLLFLHGGDAIWLPAGKHRRIVDFLGTHSGFLLITFKDSVTAPATQ